MDNHDRKRREDIARMLAETAAIIIQMLRRLDGIGMHPHLGDDMRERIAEDLTMVARDILPTVEAPHELLSIIRGILTDWVILNDLATLSSLAGVTPRKLNTMEDLAERLVVTMAVVQEMDPGLFEDRDE